MASKQYHRRMQRYRDGLEGGPEEHAKAQAYFERRRVRHRQYKLRHKTKHDPTRKYASKRKERIAGRPRPETCELCGDSPAHVHPIHWDHCHTTGAFRGWLCCRCNQVLGKADDSPALLRKLADYLENPIGPTTRA